MAEAKKDGVRCFCHHNNPPILKPCIFADVYFMLMKLLGKNTMLNKKPPKRKNKIRKRLLFGVAIIMLLFVFLVADAIARLYIFDAKPMSAPKDKVITASPIKLGQIVGISKFRSCQGHEYSGKNTDGEIESGRSMKHYLVPREDISQKLNTIEIYAPFNGTVTYLVPGSKGREMILSPDRDKNWGFLIFHIDTLSGIRNGSHITAGQLIGYANVKDRHDFDIGLTRTDGSILFEKVLSLIRGTPHFMFPKSNYLVSPFDYMDKGVTAQFREAGFDTDNLQISKDARDQKPCDFEKAAEYKDDWQYLPGTSPRETQEKSRLQEQIKQGQPAPDSTQSQTPPPQLYP